MVNRLRTSDPDLAPAPEPADLPPTPRRGRWVLLVVVLVAAAAAGWWFLTRGDSETDPAASATALRTAEVVRTDLIQTGTVDGTFGRVDGDPVFNRLSGTLTSAAGAGTTLAQGDVLFTVDDQPVVLLYGDTPAYRTLQDDVMGTDVLQLETALVALGYDPDGTVTVDDDFTFRTEQMVERWQEDVGMEDDGRVDLGELVFLPGPIRVADLSSTIGASVNNGSPVLQTSSSDTLVSVELDAADQGTLAEGESVTVILPDNSETPGTVTSVSSVASINQQGQAFFEVTITLDTPADAAGLDEAPVEVEYVTDQVSSVLAVPRTALIALAEGGYAVEVEENDGSTVLVGVDPGFFAASLVEVDASGLAVGDLVVLP